MIDQLQISNIEPIAALAAADGIAVAVVDEDGREIAAANNNSICRTLNPGGGVFSADCAKFCGKAYEMALAEGGTAIYECHAGLHCRAEAYKPPTPVAIITGRTFIHGSDYQRARKRAVEGDWKDQPQVELFENIHTCDSLATLKSVADVAKQLISLDEPAGGSEDELSSMVNRFNREVRDEARVLHPDPDSTPKTPIVESKERGTAETSVWRSFFGSLLKSDYSAACDSILEFIGVQFGLNSLVWFENRDNRFESTAGYGEMKTRRPRLGLAADDSRLVRAMHNYAPLALGERAAPGQRVRTMNLFPVGIGDEVSAAVAVLDPVDDERAKRQIARIAHSVAPQLEILRLREMVRNRRSQSDAVRRFSDGLRQIDADDLWLHLTQTVAELLRAERASLLMLNTEADRLEIKAMIGAKTSLEDDDIEIGERVAKRVLAAGEGFAVPDVSLAGLEPALNREYKTSSFLSCPVRIGERLAGVMSFTDRACGEAFDTRSLDLFQAVAPQLAVAIDRAALKEKVGEFEHLSVTDPLTGMLNRRYIEARLTEEVKRSSRHGFPMSFMMLDVDHFKSYNDEFGHPAGDEALIIVGNAIRETLRGADIAARFGGEEFAILLPQTTREEAAAIAERIRSSIEQTKFPARPVTTSIGTATCSAELCLTADVVAAADKALYEAKRRGRNQVVAFEELKHLAARQNKI